MKIIKLISKILLVALLATNIFVFSAPKAEAIIPVHDVVSYVLQGLQYVGEHLLLVSTGLPGSGAVAKGAVTAAEEGCVISEKAWRIANTVDNNVGVSILAGDAGQVAKLSTKIATLSAINNCYDTVLYAVRHGGMLGALTGLQALEQLGFSETELTNVVIAYDNRISNLVEQRDAAIKKMWEGVAYRILSSVQQQITTRLVNQMVAKYKISDFIQYEDAVATQIYTAKYVNKNFSDENDQLIIRSILANDITQNDVMPYLRTQSDQSLGFVPDQLEISDPDYYEKLARAGTGPGNPYMLQLSYQDKANMAKSEAATQAKQEISQGQGFIPARNCNGVIAQENAQMDQRRQQLGRELAVQQAAFNKIRSQQIIDPKSVDPKALTEASAALAQANTAYTNVHKDRSPFTKVCEDIRNPAVAISNFTNSYLASTLNVVNAPKPGNLPFFANFVEKVADNFLTVLVNGNGYVSGTQLLTSQGFQAANIASADVFQGITESQVLKNADKEAMASNITFSINNDTIAGQYVVSWDASALDKADHVIISGGVINNTYKAVSGRTVLNLTAGTTLTLKVYDTANKVLVTTGARVVSVQPGNLNLPTSGTNNDVIDLARRTEEELKNRGVIPPPPPISTACGGNYNSEQECLSFTGDSAYCSAICGSVQGAFTSKIPVLNIRGPVGIQPRGGY